MDEALGFAPDAAIRCREFRIGCIGAGFIMADVQLAAYQASRLPRGRHRLPHAGACRRRGAALGHPAGSTPRPRR